MYHFDFYCKKCRVFENNLLMIQRKILTQPVTVPGKNFKGQKSRITFSPAGKPGWFLDTPEGGVPIDFRIASYRRGRVVLKVGNIELHVWEHIGVLRMLGLDGIIIKVHNPWPPYLTAGQYLDRLLPHIQETTGVLPTITPRRSHSFVCKNKKDAFVSIEPSPDFILSVHSKWKWLPKHSDNFIFKDLMQNEDLLKEILYAKPQALPNRKVPAKTMAFVLRWPHMKNVAWIDDFKTKEEASYAWWLHRVQDSLGELSLCDHQAIPLVSVLFKNIGHNESLICITEVFSKN